MGRISRAFQRCMGLGGGGHLEPYFSENLLSPLTVWVFFACSGQVSNRPHLTHITECAFLGGGGWRGTPPYFGAGRCKTLCFGEA